MAEQGQNTGGRCKVRQASEKPGGQSQQPSGARKTPAIRMTELLLEKKTSLYYKDMLHAVFEENLKER